MGCRHGEESDHCSEDVTNPVPAAGWCWKAVSVTPLFSPKQVCSCSEVHLGLWGQVRNTYPNNSWICGVISSCGGQHCWALNALKVCIFVFSCSECQTHCTKSRPYPKGYLLNGLNERSRPLFWKRLEIPSQKHLSQICHVANLTLFVHFPCKWWPPEPCDYIQVSDVCF